MLEQSIHAYPNADRLQVDYQTAWAPHGWRVRHLCTQQVGDRLTVLVVVFEREVPPIQQPAEEPTP